MKYDVRNGYPATCHKCKANIVWVKSRNGKNVPCDPDGTCHFDTCGVAKAGQAQSQKKPNVEELSLRFALALVANPITNPIETPAYEVIRRAWDYAEAYLTVCKENSEPPF